MHFPICTVIMMKRLFARLLLLCCCSCIWLTNAFGQDFSNKGKDFWITFPAHVDGTGAVMGIYITSDKAATGQVVAGPNTIPFSIAANGVRRVFLGTNGDAPNNAVYLPQIEGIQTSAGIHVTSDVPVVVYAHIIRSARSGASLILPTTVWGKEYIVPSYSSSGASGANSGYGTVTVVAKEANTVIGITPAVTTRANQAAGVEYTITLSQPGDVYQVQFPKDADISGTKVRSLASAGSSCKPIGVFSSTTWSAFDCIGASGGDNLYQQLFPTRAFGKSFLTSPFIRKTYDIFRIYVTDPTTVVTRTENGATSVLTGLRPGNFYEFKTSFPNKIDADKPISVVQYMTSQTCGPTGSNVVQSDPEMVILNPVEQTINNITLFSAHRSWVPSGQSNVDKCYLNIIIKTVAAPSFRINGAPPVGSFQVIPGTAYSYLQEDVTNLSIINPVQTLVADSSFSAIAYGYGNVESYGYNAGTNVRDQFQFITIKNEYATVNFPATCVNSPFNFAITLPYEPTQLKWQFYGRFKDTTIDDPDFDSTWVVEGRNIYQYRLPGTYVLSQTGLYKVTVIANNPTSDGCSGEQQIDYEVEVFAKPKADFVWQHTGCSTDSVKFIDASNGLGRVVNRWKWSFGDNTIDSVKNPTKKYLNAGTYTVKQTIITDIGCIADTTKVIDVTLPPVANFTVSAPTCVGSSIVLTDASTTTSGNIVKWMWNYGDGRTDTLSTNAARSISYASAGTYTVTLVVQTQTGCRSAVFSKVITVSPYPVASFVMPSVVCLPNGKAQFTGTSTIADGTQASFVFNWSFGDGGTATVKDPLHTYTSVGPFSVKLTVTSAAGCADDTTMQLTNVFAQPKADFTMTNEVCLRDSSRFSDASTASNQLLQKFYWDFGNGKKDSLRNMAHLYSTAGTYNVRHWIISDKGCSSDTITKNHVVNPLPTADFTTSSPVCESNAIAFTQNAIANVGALTRWQWNMGDNTSYDNTNGTIFNHTYAAWGNKNVTLVVTNSKGCVSDTFKRVVQVHPLPKPNFTVPEVCLTDASAIFINNTTIADNSAGMQWAWHFGDGNATTGNPNTSNALNAQHKYSAVGNYNVQLKVTSAAGCVDSITQTLTVNGDKPKADFVVAATGNLCTNLPVVIQNKSTVNFGNVTKTEIYWEWPNASIVTVDDDPVSDKLYSHQYGNFNSPATKNVQVRFVAYSGGICVNEVIKTLTLHASPNVEFQTIPGICLDATPRLITQARDLAGLPGSFVYSGNGVAPNGLFTPSVAGIGTHSIQYVYASAAGCRDSASNTITVWPRPTANFTIDAPTCVTQQVTFRDASVANFGQLSNWNWTMGDGNSYARTSAAAFSHVYANTGNASITLSVVTDSGCVSIPVTKSINVHPLPVVAFTMPTVCMPVGAASFTDQSTIADGSQAQFSYRWNFGIAGLTSTLKNPQVYYPAVGTYAVKLVVTSKDGCSDSLTQQLTDVNPQPLANFTATPAEVCLGDVINFVDQSNALNQTITKWYWNLKDGSTANTQNTSRTYAAAGTYAVQFYYQTNKGCYSDTITKIVTVHPYPIVNAGPDLFVLQGGQTTIAATVTGSSNYSYNWSPAAYLNSNTILQPITKPATDITYTLRVTGAGGCSSTDNVFVKVLLDPEVPTAFSPNGDGINDVWNIKYISSYPGAVITVFDRYGKQVFVSTGYNTPWDGTFSGKPLPVGTYYYIIDPKNGRKPSTGSVTIVR